MLLILRGGRCGRKERQQRRQGVCFFAWVQQVSSIRKKRRSPIVWVMNYLKKREQNSQCFNVMVDLQDHSIRHPRIFTNSYGVDPEMFNFLCKRLAPLITRQNTNYRRATRPLQGFKECIRDVYSQYFQNCVRDHCGHNRSFLG